jgi:two-component system response regulator VicR
VEQPQILVVDDERPFCDVVREILSSYGFEVHTANDVEGALARLGDLQPDLILLDVMMPKINGLALLRHIRKHPVLSKTPTLVVSAKTMHEDRRRAAQAGADDFLAKPFTMQELRSAVDAFLPMAQPVPTSFS